MALRQSLGLSWEAIHQEFSLTDNVGAMIEIGGLWFQNLGSVSCAQSAWHSRSKKEGAPRVGVGTIQLGPPFKFFSISAAILATLLSSGTISRSRCPVGLAPHAIWSFDAGDEPLPLAQPVLYLNHVDNGPIEMIQPIA